MITVKIPAPMRPLTQNQAELSIPPAATVKAALDDVTKRFPGLREKILDDRGALRRYVNVFRNDDDVRAARGLDTELKDGDRLTIVPAIAGGC